MNENPKYYINPVKASVEYCTIKGHNDLQDLNDACYGVCSAFSGTSDAWTVPQDCAGECKELLQQKKLQVYGLSDCDHHTPYRPVIWDSSPNYFPTLYTQYRNVDRARNECMKMCEGEQYPLECKNKCQLQSLAIVEGLKNKPDNSQNDIGNIPVFSKYERAHPVVYWIGFSVSLIVFLIILGLFIKNIINK